MRFGVHVSIGAGFAKSVARAESLGCEAFQIFAGNPRGWARQPLADRDAASFREALAASGLGPVVVHLSYLPNPASLDDGFYERSVLAMGEDFARASRLGAAYFVVHPGSCPAERKAEGRNRVVRAVEAVLARVPGSTMLLLENQGGRRRDLAADLTDLTSMLIRLDRDRVGLCLDTCHAFVAGYDLRTEDRWGRILGFLDREAGLDRLRVIHANDAKTGLDSGIDRHEHIGEGFLGASAFAAMGRMAGIADRAVILETPQDDPNDDPRNLARIRSLVAEGA